MKRNSLIEKIRNEITEDIKREVDLSFEISDRISEILAKQNKTQRDLAKSLHKSEAEVSKWMHGTHNFTIHTIAKIEMVLGEKILNVSKQEKKEANNCLTMIIHPQKQYTSSNPVGSNMDFPLDWKILTVNPANKINKCDC